jgi:hypothetical protein
VNKEMTVDRALARIMELHTVPPVDAVFRQEVRKILSDVRHAGYCQGSDDARYEGVQYEG